MKAQELSKFLMLHPDYEVHVETPDTIERVNGAGTDCFEADEGFVFVLTLEQSE